MNKDTIKGDVKETVGKATGDSKTEAKGKLDSFIGKVKESAHEASDKVHEKVEDIKDKLDGE